MSMFANAVNGIRTHASPIISDIQRSFRAGTLDMRAGFKATGTKKNMSSAAIGRATVGGAAAVGAGMGMYNSDGSYGGMAGGALKGGLTGAGVAGSLITGAGYAGRKFFK